MKRSVLLLVSGIIGIAYLIYIISYFASASTTNAGGAIATALVMPHMICVLVAVVFNVLGWVLRARWAALVAGIMYSVSAVLMLIYAPFVLVELILCFVAFGKMKAVKASA